LNQNQARETNFYQKDSMTQNNQPPSIPPPAGPPLHPAVGGTTIPSYSNQPCPTCGRRDDPDEINLLEYTYVLVKNKWWIIGMTVLGLALGYVAALAKGPRYVAEAVIAPQESESQKSPSLSALGALGAFVPLTLSGNASLEKVNQVLGSREFNAKLVAQYGLLPDIYRHEWPKEYRKWYDEGARQWKPGFTPPGLLDMGEFSKSKYLKIDNKNNTIILTVTSKDSSFADSLMAHYLEFLDLYIRTNVQQEATENVAYLNTRLDSIADPILREKIRDIIAKELEKAMVVSKKAFTIIDVPYRTYIFKQKKLFPMVSGAGMLFLTLLVIVLRHAFSSSVVTHEDRDMIAGIKKELWMRRK
jgi:hypothetical protein